ncbi:hypothetical protein [Kordia sp.]|uniref:hypothetical protein n=1 Tax=Kordia sp. TaxID=1965332 RepID=UPI003B5A859A
MVGEEIARLEINQVSTHTDNLVIKEVDLALKKGDEIAFWSEMDFKYEGNAELRFKIEILKDGEKYGGLEIDPTDKNMTIGETKTVFNSKTNWSFTGKNAEIEIKEDGKYTFKGILVATKNATLEITKAEVVLKQ